mmetsp:Transcript_1159/g.3524  ORF Transcript_1159/g.3524 Transcript_1159/m.3524 type:complete len:200 (-) Transcript_1159:43-642(-)
MPFALGRASHPRVLRLHAGSHTGPANLDVGADGVVVSKPSLALTVHLHFCPRFHCGTDDGPETSEVSQAGLRAGAAHSRQTLLLKRHHRCLSLLYPRDTFPGMVLHVLTPRSRVFLLFEANEVRWTKERPVAFAFASWIPRLTGTVRPALRRGTADTRQTALRGAHCAYAQMQHNALHGRCRPNQAPSGRGCVLRMLAA